MKPANRRWLLGKLPKIFLYQKEDVVLHKKSPTKLYFAGPLFTIAERTFNRNLRDALVALGYDVFLPQESEADNREVFDHEEVAQGDRRAIEAADVLIANLDGPVADDGTALETGFAIGIGKITVGYRTDIRSSGDDPKIRVNLMFRLMDTVVHYRGEDVDVLASFIHKDIQELLPDGK